MTLLLLNYFELNFILGTTFFPNERSNLWKGLPHIFDIPSRLFFFRFDIPSVSLDIPHVLFPMPISLFEELGITIANALYLIFCTKNPFNKKLF